MSYRPRPIDTASIELTPALLELREHLAQHVHDVWVRGRIREGWVYGLCRNDEEKTHPGLVPFEALSESEKDYDRATAMETLKAIIARGWEIRKTEE